MDWSRYDCIKWTSKNLGIQIRFFCQTFKQKIAALVTTMHRIIFKKIYFFNVRIKKIKNITTKIAKKYHQSKKVNFWLGSKMAKKISSQFPDSHLILVLLIFVSQIDPILLSMPPTDYLLCILEKKIAKFRHTYPIIFWISILPLFSRPYDTIISHRLSHSIVWSLEKSISIESLAKISPFESFLSEHVIFDQIFRYLIV